MSAPRDGCTGFVIFALTAAALLYAALAAIGANL